MIACPSACTALTGTDALLSLCASWLTSRTNKHEKKQCRQRFFFIQFFITILSYNWARFLFIFIALSCSAPTNSLQICIYSYIFIDIYRLTQYAFCWTHIFWYWVLATFLLCTFFEKKWKLSACGIRELFKLNHNSIKQNTETIQAARSNN